MEFSLASLCGALRRPMRRTTKFEPMFLLHHPFFVISVDFTTKSRLSGAFAAAVS
jgi:hypothetical protein